MVNEKKSDEDMTNTFYYRNTVKNIRRTTRLECNESYKHFLALISYRALFDARFSTIFVGYLNELRQTPFYGYAFMINRINRLFYLIRHLRVKKIEDFFK